MPTKENQSSAVSNAILMVRNFLLRKWILIKVP